MFPKTIIAKNDQVFIIRQAEKKDAAALLQYANKIGGETDFLTFGENGIKLSIEEEKKFIQSFEDSDNSVFLVAEINGEIVGNVSFMGGKMERIRHQGELGIAVVKAYWGIGIGKSLMLAAIEWAKTTNLVKKIYLEVIENNPRAIKLYEELGFIKEGIIINKILLNREYYSTIAMGLMINEY